jgi:hypothetical protein
MTTIKPSITFFCEMPSNQLKKLFDNSLLIEQLQKMRANISMGLLDFSTERAELVKQLTHAGIPVTAWLLLPKDQGYWTSLDTVAETVHCYSEFKEWTAKNKLHWAAIGLDIEPRLDRVQLLGPGWVKEIPTLLVRLFLGNLYKRRETDLRALITNIRADGYAVETYNFPFIIEEREADSNFISKIFGTPPLESDREVLMLYSSFQKKNGDAFLWSYAPRAEGIGLGSTGGGVELEDGEPLKTMNWSDLHRDLLIAKSFNQHIYLFSLEGCVQNGYLERLVNFDWDEAIEFPIQTGSQVTLLRKLLQIGLWIASHPIEILLTLFSLKLLFRKKK